MINGFSHTSKETSPLSEGSVFSAQPGFNGGLFANTGKSDDSALSFSALLNSEPGASQAGSTLLSDNNQSADSVSESLPQLTESENSNQVLSDRLSTVMLSTTDTLKSIGSDSASTKTASPATSSTMKDSLVAAISNASSTNTTLTTAQIATNQLATNSALDGKLIDVTVTRDTSLSVDPQLANNAQLNRSEIASLQFKAVVDRSLSAQEMGERLSSTIADKVSIQVNAKTPTATIRLDPPDLGKIDLVVKLDHDKLNIQINASSGATRESIQMTSDRLRAELVEQNFLHVEVSISGENQQASERNEMVVDEDFTIVANPAATHPDAEESNDNNELARA